MYTKKLSDYWDDPKHHYGFRQGIPGSNQIQEALSGKGEAVCLYYNKEKLLENGERWEAEIARNIELDAPYR